MSRFTLGRVGAARRYWVLILSAIVVLAIALPWSMLGAGATVSNPGSVTLTFTDGSLTTALGAFGPITGTLSNGTVTGAGALSFPQANAAFTPFLVHVTNPLPLDVNISPIANSDFTGNIDPDSGAMTLSGSISVNLAIATLGLTACPLGPLSVNFSNANTGGVPYNKGTGVFT